jgi:HD-GYP domain-containing protein (c-di-GMP phosphodiesterase class II)
MNSVRRNSYKELRARNKLLEITRKAAAFFELNNKEREKLLLLAKHHDLGKLALDRNILKKGGRLTAEEWHEYQKHVLITANFVSYYHDLAGITNLALAQYEHFDGSGWPEALKAEEIPYLSRLFAVINFYSKLNSNLYYPFSKDKYYFGALEVREIIKELINYRSKVFDPQIVDEFIEFLEKAV